MMRILPILPLALLTAACSPAAESPAAVNDSGASGVAADSAVAAQGEATMLTAEDGTRIFGTFYEAADPKAIILLFHQAGGSKAEYTSIGPKLAKAGYSAFAIDQRSGGDRFGTNETVAARGGSTDDYLAVMSDLEAALAWAEAKQLPVAIWGSSYSSSLVFLLAAEHPGAVTALLSFSPGEYLDGDTRVRDAAAKVQAPVFVTSASKPGEIASARAIFEAVPGKGNTRYVPDHGVHGSSTLNAERNSQGAAANWEAVMAFLKRTLG